MLSFYSASVRIANSARAVDELVETAFGEGVPADCRVIMVNAAIGHKLDKVAAALEKHAPGVLMVGASCGGVAGREGVGEALSHMALMGVSGSAEECAAAAVDDIHADNAYEKGFALAKALQASLGAPRVIYLLCPGLDIACDQVLAAFTDVFGREVIIFGGLAADNYKAITSFQYIGDRLTEHGAWAVGFADPTLQAVAKASHGFLAYGEPMIVTKAAGNKIYEMDGMPPWQAYRNRLSLMQEDNQTLTVIAAGGLARELPVAVAAEYGNPHILRGPATGANENVMCLAVSVAEGEKYWLTTRDEAFIFSEQEKALAYLRAQIGDRQVVAVFQADCLARGRTLFNKVMKDELIGMMQSVLANGEEIPPWLGMYGFGEFCPLAGENVFHTYTTSLLVLYR